MARHARPDVELTVSVAGPQGMDGATRWELGVCWLCEEDAVKPVTWAGPAVVHTLNGPQRAPLYACAPCLTRIAARVTTYRRQRGL